MKERIKSGTEVERRRPYRKKKSQSSGSTCFWFDLSSLLPVKDVTLSSFPAAQPLSTSGEVDIFSRGGYFHFASGRILGEQSGSKAIFKESKLCTCLSFEFLTFDFH